MHAMSSDSISGAYECMFSWLLEICAGKWPAVVSQGFFLFWVGSWLTITPIAYHFRAWRDLLMAVSIPKFFLFFIGQVFFVCLSFLYLRQNGLFKQLSSFPRVLNGCWP